MDSKLARGQTPSVIRRAVDARGLQQFGAATAALFLLGGVAVFHCWARASVTDAGYALSRLSHEHHELARENERLQLAAAELKSPARIAALARARLGMGLPRNDRVIVLRERQDALPDEDAVLVAARTARP